MAKSKSLRLFQYLTSKDGETKYLKLNDNPKASKKEKAMIKALKKILGKDGVMYINLFDDRFRKKYKVPKFVKGSVSVPDPDREEDDDEDEDEEEDEDQDDDSDDDSDDEDEDDEEEDDEDSDDDDDEDDEDDDDSDDDDE